MISAKSFKNAIRYQKNPKKTKKTNYRKRFCEKTYTFTRGCFFCFFGFLMNPVNWLRCSRVVFSKRRNDCQIPAATRKRLLPFWGGRFRVAIVFLAPAFSGCFGAVCVVDWFAGWLLLLLFVCWLLRLLGELMACFSLFCHPPFVCLAVVCLLVV